VDRWSSASRHRLPERQESAAHPSQDRVARTRVAADSAWPR
jgi:hypothetical protein